jgi:hypothetical protein
MEPDVGGDVGRAVTRQQQAAGEIDPATGQVLVRRQPVLGRERADQVLGAGLEQSGRVGEAEPVGDAFVE